MIERDYGVRFLLKALQALRVAGKPHGQKFECGLAPRCDVGGEIHFTHPTGADPFRNFVVTERPTDEQVSLPVFNDSRRNTDSRAFDKAAYSLTRSEERFNFAPQ